MKVEMKLVVVYIATVSAFMLLVAQILPGYLASFDEKAAALIMYRTDPLSASYAAICFMLPPVVMFLGSLSLFRKNANHAIFAIFFLIIHLTFSDNWQTGRFYPVIMISTVVYTGGCCMLRHLAEENLQRRRLLQELAGIRIPLTASDREAFILRRRHLWGRRTVLLIKCATISMKLLIFILCIYLVVVAPGVIKDMSALEWLTIHRDFKPTLLNSFVLLTVLLVIFVTVWCAAKVYDFMYTVRSQGSETRKQICRR